MQLRKEKTMKGIGKLSLMSFRFNDQWTIEVGENGLDAYNEAPDGTLLFYTVKLGNYGNPIIYVEPDLAFWAPQEVIYVNFLGEIIDDTTVIFRDAAGDNVTTKTLRIGGIICRDGAEIVRRFSLSGEHLKKLQEKPHLSVDMNHDGSCQIGEETWYLAAIVIKDKNRFYGGLDGFFTREKPDAVTIFELENLPVV